MTHKYERKCWYCGSRDMENKGSYVQCRSCGATWNETPVIKEYLGIEIERGGQDGKTKYHPVKKGGAKMPPLSDRSRQAKKEARKAGQPIY